MKSALLLLTVAALIELPIGTALWSQHATLITNLIKATSLILWAVTLVTGATILVGVLAAVRFASSFLAGMAVIATTLLASLVGAVGGLAAPFAAVWFIGRQWPVLSDSDIYGILLTTLPTFIGIAGAVGLPLLTLGRVQSDAESNPPTSPS